MFNINFTPFPTFTTERLTLRELSINDQQNIFALRSNTEINKYLDRVPSSTIEDAISFIKKINDNIKKNNSIYWVITLTKSKTFVGTICLFAFSNQKNKCEIGYELLPNFQGQGLMKEATAYTHNSNKNSTKLLEKVGFTKSLESDLENPDIDIFTLLNWLDEK
jgi:[ribosomal protein S5]-alanine N-acetyltransferase